MATNVVSLNVVESVKNIHECLKSEHNGFPIVNSNGVLVGLVSQDILVTLIKNKEFYNKPNDANASINSNTSKSKLQNTTD
jgi:CBS-domain-containing membrane protein